MRWLVVALIAVFPVCGRAQGTAPNKPAPFVSQIRSCFTPGAPCDIGSDSIGLRKNDVTVDLSIGGSPWNPGEGALVISNDVAEGGANAMAVQALKRGVFPAVLLWNYYRDEAAAYATPGDATNRQGGLFLGASELVATAAAFTGSISGTTLTVTGIASGAISPGQYLSSGSAIAPHTVITAWGTGIGGIGTYKVSVAQTVPREQMSASLAPASFMASISGTTLTVSSILSGALAVGQTVGGPGSRVQAGTVVTELESGTGGTGTYRVNVPQSVASTPMIAGVGFVTPPIEIRQDWDDFQPIVRFAGTVNDAGTVLTVRSISSGGDNIKRGQILYWQNQASGSINSGLTIGQQIGGVDGGAGSYKLDGIATFNTALFPANAALSANAPSSQDLTTRSFLHMVPGSLIANLFPLSTCGGQTNSSLMSLNYFGGIEVCGPGGYYGGVMLSTNYGAIVGKLDGSGCGNGAFWNSNCSFAEMVASSGAAGGPNDGPAIGFDIEGRHRFEWKMAGRSSGPWSLNMVDVDTSHTVPFAINGWGSGSGPSFTFTNAAGTCSETAGSSAPTVSCSSDANLKRDIRPAWFNLFAARQMWEYPIRSFVIKSTGQKSIGVVAQEIQRRNPAMVHETALCSKRDDRGACVAEDKILMVDAPNPYVMVLAIQQLAAVAAVSLFVALIAVLGLIWQWRRCRSALAGLREIAELRAAMQALQAARE